MAERSVKYTIVSEKSLNDTTCDRRILANAIINGSRLIKAEKIESSSFDLFEPQGIIRSTIKTKLILADTSKEPASAHKMRLLSRIFLSTDDLKDLTLTMGVFYSVLSTLFEFVYNDDFKTNLNKAGYEVELVNYSDYIDYLATKGINIEEQVDELYEQSRKNNLDSCTLPCVGMLILITAKNLTPQNYQEWDNKRISSLLESLGGPEDTQIKKLPVTVKNAHAINQICSVIISTRLKILSQVLTALDLNTQEGKLLKIMKQNIKWYQMSNFWLVTNIIVKTHPYLMIWGEISTQFYDYEKAMAMFNNNESTFPYIKYANPNISTDVFNSTSIQFLASIARYVAINEGMKSYENYYTGYTGDLPTAKIDLIMAVAKSSSFVWADYIKHRILKESEENKNFYSTIYSSEDGVDDDEEIRERIVE